MRPESVVVWSECLFGRHGRGTMRMIINKLPPALAALALLGVLTSAPASVRAASNDIQLSGNLTREDFRSLTRQVGFAASYFPLAPAALRISGTKLFGGSEVHLKTYSADLSISKGFLFLIPYAGVGQLLVNSRKNSAAIRAANGADFRETENLTKGFGGLKIAPPVLPLSFVAEADFGTVTAYSLRINISF